MAVSEPDSLHCWIMRRTYDEIMPKTDKLNSKSACTGVHTSHG